MAESQKLEFPMATFSVPRMGRGEGDVTEISRFVNGGNVEKEKRRKKEKKKRAQKECIHDRWR